MLFYDNACSLRKTLEKVRVRTSSHLMTIVQMCVIHLHKSASYMRMTGWVTAIALCIPLAEVI
jgi:hypothetical protein